MSHKKGAEENCNKEEAATLQQDKSGVIESVDQAG
jgi:hypothetical protein